MHAAGIVEWKSRQPPPTELHVLTRHVLPSIAMTMSRSWNRHVLSVTEKKSSPKRVADVGTGGGFPGLSLAIVSPDVQFTLIDSTTKKVRALESIVKDVGAVNVQCWSGRAEDFKGERFDVVVGRSVANLPKFCASVSPLVKPETLLFYIRGGPLLPPLSMVPWRERASVSDLLGTFHPELEKNVESDKEVIVYDSTSIKLMASLLNDQLID